MPIFLALITRVIFVKNIQWLERVHETRVLRDKSKSYGVRPAGAFVDIENIPYLQSYSIYCNYFLMKRITYAIIVYTT